MGLFSIRQIYNKPMSDNFEPTNSEVTNFEPTNSEPTNSEQNISNNENKVCLYDMSELINKYTPTNATLDDLLSDNILINSELTKSTEEKDKFVDNFIYKTMMPYILYMKLMLNDDEIYEKLKSNQNQTNPEKINLYFLMEVLKKRIEIVDC